MPRAPGQLHALNAEHLAKANQRLRRTRETYVPSRLPRILKEEGRLMLDFDLATTLEGRLKALDGLLRVRRMVMDMVGWPKPPTMRPGNLPAALDSVRNHNPIGDLDISTEVVPIPEPPTEG